MLFFLKISLSGLVLTESQSVINRFWWCGSEYGTLWAGHCVWVAKVP